MVGYADSDSPFNIISHIINAGVSSIDPNLKTL
jgi:hypothetical protein